MSATGVGPSAPFTHAPASVGRTMWLVLLALAPATAFDLYLFGWPAILLFAETLGACAAAEALCLVLADRPVGPALADGSALVTGWLLALSLPPWAPWWTGALGAVFAIPLAKHAFGGLGQNPFNPAMVARVALLVSFPVAMTAWVAPHPLFAANSPGFVEGLRITFGAGTPDTVSAATALGYIKTELTRGIPVSQSVHQTPDLLDMALGIEPGSMGETSKLLILAGGLFLLARGIISWHIPAGLMGALFAIATLFHAINPDRFAGNLDADQWRHNPVGEWSAELADRFHRHDELWWRQYSEFNFTRRLRARVFVRGERRRRRDHQGELQQWAIEESRSDYLDRFPEPERVDQHWQ